MSGSTFWPHCYLHNRHRLVGASKAHLSGPHQVHHQRASARPSFGPPNGYPFNLCTKLLTEATYVEQNSGFIVDYAERRRYGERVSTGFVESAVNQVLTKRMVKRQQMQ